MPLYGPNEGVEYLLSSVVESIRAKFPREMGLIGLQPNTLFLLL